MLSKELVEVSNSAPDTCITQQPFQVQQAFISGYSCLSVPMDNVWVCASCDAPLWHPQNSAMTLTNKAVGPMKRFAYASRNKPGDLDRQQCLEAWAC